MKWVAAAALMLGYWGICVLCTGTDEKNLASLRAYPNAVQVRVRAESSLQGKLPKAKPQGAVFLSNFLLFTAVLALIGWAFKGELETFSTAFGYLLAVGEGLNLFDLLVVDLLWWRNSPRVRFSFLPEKEHYQAAEKHVQAFVRGIPMFALSALAAAGIGTLLA